MSAANRMFMLGGVFVAGLFIFANALYWFITPMAHPAASQGRMVAVGVQALVGLAVSAYGYMAQGASLLPTDLARTEDVAAQRLSCGVATSATLFVLPSKTRSRSISF